MAKSLRIEVHRKGVGELLKSQAVTNDLRARAGRIATAAGPGNEVETNVTAQRARAVVVTRTYEAKKAEATARSLSGALDAGRG